MSDLLEAEVLKKPLKYYDGVKPDFYFVKSLDIGSGENKAHIVVDALKLTNFGFEAQKYFEAMFKDKIAKGYTNLEAFRFSENSTTMIVTRDADGRINFYLTPNNEVTNLENEHLNGLKKELRLYDSGREYNPFASSGSNEPGKPSDNSAYINAIIRFNQDGRSFVKSQGIPRKVA